MNRPNRPLLFLDIDGVLRTKKAFDGKLKAECLAHLHRVVDTTGCDLVLTSTWADVMPLPKISALIGRELIGQIPYVPESQHEHPRFIAIRRYLSSAGLSLAKWVAVDDRADLFPVGLDRLVLTDPEVGLDDVAAAKLLSLLASRG